jgi:predicted aldo/keto reductase-like oxidoreductase
VVGEVMKTRRGEVFLATKINKRRRDSVRKELEESLKKLQTDHVDLIQIHAVNAFADLEQALAPDGALAALEEARQEGLVRFIGITGHARPEVLAHALRQYPFDAVLCALGIIDHLVTAPHAFMLPLAREQSAGVIAMKVYGHGEVEQRELALRYSLGLPGVSLAILGMDSEKQIDENVALAARFQPLSEQEEIGLIEAVRALIQKDAEQSQKGRGGKPALFWLHDTAVMGWREKDEPALVAY